MLFVGEAPTIHAERGPLSGRSGARLARLAGLSLDEWLAATERRNLFAEPQPSGRWDVNTRASAKACAMQIVVDHPGEPIAALGRRVAAAFGVPKKAEWLEPVEVDGVVVTPVPHPSGRSLFYNDEANRERVARFLRGVLSPT